jgi:hypothetical protein
MLWILATLSVLVIGYLMSSLIGNHVDFKRLFFWGVLLGFPLFGVTRLFFHKDSDELACAPVLY